MAVYAPNVGQREYLETMSPAYFSAPGAPGIWAGDFNCVHSSDLDRSVPPLPGTQGVRATQAFQEWSQITQLQDVWRAAHRLDREFSHYAPGYSVHTRLDYLFCTVDRIPHMLNSEYLGRTLSDHSPLKITMQWGRVRPPIPMWRLRPEALNEPPFKVAIGEQVVNYFELNGGSTEFRRTEWDAMKVVLRGHCMKTVWGVKTTLLGEMAELEARLRIVEVQASSHPERWVEHGQIQKELDGVYSTLGKYEYNTYLTHQHMEGDKPGRTLAWLLRSETPRTVIGAIRNKHGVLVNTQITINEVFRDYYRDLYRAPTVVEITQIRRFVEEAGLPYLAAPQREGLEGSITEGEIRAAIRNIARNKIPGIDGYPIEFYAAYEEWLSPRLL